MTQTLTSFDSLVQCATLDYLHQSRCKRVWRLVLLLHLSSHYPASAQWNNKPLKISEGSVCGSGGTYDHCATSQCTHLFCLSRKIQLQTNQKWDKSCNMRPVLCRFLICCDADSNIRQHGECCELIQTEGNFLCHQLRVSIILSSRGQQLQTSETSTQVILHLNSRANICVLQRKHWWKMLT